MITTDVDAGADWDPDSPEPDGPGAGWVAWSDRLITAAFAAADLSALLAPAVTAEVSLVLTDDATVRGLNRDWRGKDKATNVLSFPQADPVAIAAPPIDRPLLLGDIVLARGVCATEAAARGVPLRDHAAHLVVHGALHLAGLDHERGEAEADAMEAIERRALAALGLHDPYPDEAADPVGAADQQQRMTS